MVAILQETPTKSVKIAGVGLRVFFISE